LKSYASFYTSALFQFVQEEPLAAACCWNSAVSRIVPPKIRLFVSPDKLARAWGYTNAAKSHVPEAKLILVLVPWAVSVALESEIRAETAEMPAAIRAAGK
jgi:hypothetical protein